MTPALREAQQDGQNVMVIAHLKEGHVEGVEDLFSLLRRKAKRSQALKFALLMGNAHLGFSDLVSRQLNSRVGRWGFERLQRVDWWLRGFPHHALPSSSWTTNGQINLFPVLTRE
jgi:hypothetical protein